MFSWQGFELDLQFRQLHEAEALADVRREVDRIAKAHSTPDVPAVLQARPDAEVPTSPRPVRTTGAVPQLSFAALATAVRSRLAPHPHLAHAAEELLAELLPQLGPERRLTGAQGRWLHDRLGPVLEAARAAA